MVEEKYKCEVREDEEESCDDMFELEVINVKSWFQIDTHTYKYNMSAFPHTGPRNSETPVAMSITTQILATTYYISS